MSNRYLITLFHWLTAVLLGSLTLFLLTKLSTDVLLLSLLFGGIGSSAFFLLSLFFIPRILRQTAGKNIRVALLTLYTSACCFGGFTLLVAFDVVSWGDLFGGNKSDSWFMGDVNKALGYSFYTYMVAGMLSSVLWASIYVPKESVRKDLGVLDLVD